MFLTVFFQVVLEFVNPAVVFRYFGSEGDQKCFCEFVDYKYLWNSDKAQTGRRSCLLFHKDFLLSNEIVTLKGDCIKKI